MGVREPSCPLIYTSRQVESIIYNALKFTQNKPNLQGSDFRFPYDFYEYSSSYGHY